MQELRQDIFSGKSVIINEARGKRPQQFESELSDVDKDCFFCLGNEHKTPPATFVVGEDPWKGRVVPNKFPIVNKEGGLLRGHHEVVIESNKHHHNFFNMTQSDFERVIHMYRQRYKSHLKDDNVKYISIFKNHKREAGASLEHPHSQIIALPIIPKDVKDEFFRCRGFYASKNKSLHEQVMEEELREDLRVIHNSLNFMVVAPYASLFNYEVQIIYKHSKGFSQLSQEENSELASIYEKLFKGLHEKVGDVPFNMFFHLHPIQGEVAFYHWHIHVTPRLSMQAGFELSTGIYVNTISPEQTAKVLRW